MLKALIVCLSTAALASAQYAPAPQAYTVVQRNSLFGPLSIMQVYRDGSKAVLDLVQQSAQPGDKPTQVRTVYDLQAHTNVSWSPDDPDAQCGSGTFSGEWGDPFSGSAALMAELNQSHPVQTGTETVKGLPTKVFEFVMAGTTGKSKVWVDTKYGLIMQLKMAQPSGEPKLALETTSVNLAAPPASAFALSCKAAPPVPTEADKIVTLTGGPASNFADATEGPATGGGCLVLFRVVRAGSMTTVTSGYQLTVEGKPVPVQNGVARIVNAPQQFSLDVRLANGGATATLWRQCSAPQTTLLLVAKDWDKLGEGADWLWVKSGKFAGH